MLNIIESEALVKNDSFSLNKNIFFLEKNFLEPQYGTEYLHKNSVIQFYPKKLPISRKNFPKREINQKPNDAVVNLLKAHSLCYCGFLINLFLAMWLLIIKISAV